MIIDLKKTGGGDLTDDKQLQQIYIIIYILKKNPC